jgi:protein-disulfide isomerase
VQLGLSIGAGLVGFMLLVLQVLLGHICPYCCVADVSGVLALLLALLRLRARDDGHVAMGWSFGGAGAMVAAAAVPLGAGFHANTTPQAIHDEIAKTPAGLVTVVDFVDFECPFCRMTDAELEPVLASHKDKIHLVRRQVPLTMHAHARDAARAACCGEKLGKGDEMASSLFTSEVEDLTPAGCEKIAAALGLPLDAYRACVQSPDTDASIDRDKDEFKAAHGYALPTIWVDETPMIGARPREDIEKVVGEAGGRARLTDASVTLTDASTSLTDASVKLTDAPVSRYFATFKICGGLNQ